MNNPKQLVEIIGLFLIFISLLIGLSLWSYDVSDPTLNQSVSASVEIKNSAGTFGAYLSGFLADLFGLLSYFWVFFFFATGLACITKRFIPAWYVMLGYSILFLCAILAAEALTLGVKQLEGGGVLGAWLYAILHMYFNPIGSACIWFFALLIGLELCFRISWVAVFAKILSVSQKAVVHTTKSAAQNLPKKLAKSKNSKDSKDSKDVKDTKDTKNTKDTKDAKDTKKTNDIKESKNSKDIKTEKNKDFKKDADSELKTDNNIKDIKLTEKDPLGLGSKGLTFEASTDDKDNNSIKENTKLSFGDAKGENTEYNADKDNSKEKKKSFWRSVFFSNEKDEDEDEIADDEEDDEEIYVDSELPPIDLLSSIPEPVGVPSKESLEAKGEDLIQCLLDFNVQGSLAGVLPGPVVTMFEVRPDKGVKAKRFELLSKDIAMAIKALAVRVQAPIPGTDTVGIEVPNDTRQVVSFREIIQSDAFTKSDSVLSLGLGKDIFGKPICGKMEEMPHLLVAGATGAGKSVCLNSIILSILYKARPHEVKMLLIDPKRVELAMYADLPHLVHPVVTDMDLAKNALLWAIDEMDQRYQLFQNNKVRNFSEYNNLIKKINTPKEEINLDLDINLDDEDNALDEFFEENSHSENPKKEESKLKPLPYIVIIVDELADLMMQKGKEVEASIVRLAQLARAAGIHLIIATQRPSVDVVTGLIKANFPSRIAFQVTSGTDSRTILDSVGAEALLGKGDMLFKPRAGALQRMHGAFVTDEEVNSVVEFWKKDRKVSYTVDFTQYGEKATESAFSEKNDSHDPMFDTILERIVDMDEISISMLQRHFKLGFGRAGRIMDQLERDGIVGPSSGSKPRKVLR